MRIFIFGWRNTNYEMQAKNKVLVYICYTHMKYFDIGKKNTETDANFLSKN